VSKRKSFSKINYWQSGRQIGYAPENAVASEQINFSLTEEGRRYLKRKSVSEVDFFLSNKSLEDLCEEYSLKEGIHFKVKKINPRKYVLSKDIFNKPV